MSLSPIFVPRLNCELTDLRLEIPSFDLCSVQHYCMTKQTGFFLLHFPFWENVCLFKLALLNRSQKDGVQY